MINVFQSCIVLAVVATAGAASLFSCANPGNDCANGGVCDYFTGSCECTAGWAGESCTVVASMVCTSRTCNNNGVCELAAGVPVCRCNAGYSGDDCEVTPMSCQCTGTSMTISMSPPGDFSSGVGYVEGDTTATKSNPNCQTTGDASGQHTITLDHNSATCEALQQLDAGTGDGGYFYQRTFHFRYNPILITRHGIAFTCQCVYSPSNQVIYTTITGIDSSDLSGLIQQVATSEIYPVSYVLTSNGARITSTSNLIIGQNLDLTLSADAGFCAVIDSIVVNNTVNGGDYREATLLENGCRTDLGQIVLETELIPASNNLSTWSVAISAFLLDNSNVINMAISFRAYSSGDARCVRPICTGVGRKKRQAEPFSTGDEKTGTFNPVLYIQYPGHSSAAVAETAREASLSTSVMVALIVMAAVIVVLLVVCLVVGLALVLRRRRENNQSEYSK